MSEDDDFAKLWSLELLAKSRNEKKSRSVLEVLLTDLSFDPDGQSDDACKAIDQWEHEMDAVIAKDLDRDSIGFFVALVVKNSRAIEMSRLSRERHVRRAPAINWVRAEWGRKASEYRSKRDFARTYVMLVIEDFPEVKKITLRTISEEWLKGLVTKKRPICAQTVAPGTRFGDTASEGY